jgi:D-alanyl-lipoteichoic acid acyltransferase DltB (MBOAT superfamily)
MTFVVVLITWVFFRADDLPGALLYLQSMVGLATVQESAGLFPHAT